MKPIISVLLPTHNRSEWLREALVSIALQDVPLQLVVLNNGSTDRGETQGVIYDYAKLFDNITVLEREQNSIDNIKCMDDHIDSSCKYVVNFCDDDRMLFGNLKTKIDILEKYPHVTFSYSQAKCIDQNGASLDKLMGSPYKALYFEDMLPTSQVVMSSVVMRASGVRVKVPSIDCIYGEWLQYLSIMAYSGSAVGCDTPLTELRLHSQSDTEKRGKQDKKVLGSHFNVWKHFIEDQGYIPSYYCLWDKITEVHINNALTTLGQGFEFIDEIARFSDFRKRNGG